ncbi:tol-pal system-associated acyl-CoA thioesterase [Paracoccus sp. SCSIO 75233]|uniref:tol-pal system-associated acyl-CoA thioesterase n=1 Tax=Paracoccus sp. SCSIO 75233 TaxID=3017782 RepID=UPI0022F0EBF2|nr:tol-pal system-associated acyl-CoA thioesterase [Paracoccus sp. SCSIO 75233]WBU54840.1 tol-pal system-associated acyl-CoA thioesterase [Paracoccus sp. SCSIO 75233]
MMHRWPVRVYYEDTDLAGIVYYANYLKFIERARTEWIRELGFDQTRLKQDQGIVFAVRRVEADYLAPAVFDDALTVTTSPVRITPARIELDQQVTRGEQVLFAAKVTLACLGPDMRPRRLPGDLGQLMRS